MCIKLKHNVSVMFQDSWYVILCDKFRNERRGLGGAGTSPRMGKTKKEQHDPHSLALAADHQVSMDTADEATLEGRSEIQV